MRTRLFLLTGAATLALWLGGNAVQAQYNPGGWIQTGGWNLLFPLGNPYGCNGGGPDGGNGSTAAGNWVAPHDIGLEDPQAGDEWTDIAFGGAALSTGWGATVVNTNPIWVTEALLESAFAGFVLPVGDVIDYQGMVDAINTYAGSTIGGDNVIGIATTYVENTTGAPLAVQICSASDDSIKVYVNNVPVTDVSWCRGTAGDCAERRPAILPPGVSKIATLTMEGGGGWGFRLAIEVDGVKATDGAGRGLVFLGPEGAGQEQFYALRTQKTDTLVCDSGEVEITGVGPGNGADAVVVTETISSGSVQISGVSDGGTVTDIVLSNDGIDLTTGAVQEFFVLGPIANPLGAGPGDAAVRAGFLSIPDADVATLTEGQVVNDINSVARTVQRLRVNNGDGLDFNIVEGDVDNIMHYAWTKVTVTQDTDVAIGVASDDSVQVLLDGVEILICGNCPRGWGANGEAQNVTENRCAVTLTAGTHTIVTKTFEGGGGHGVRLLVYRIPTGGVGAGGADCASATPIAPGEYGIGCTVGGAVGTACDPQNSPANYYVVEGTGLTMTAQTCLSKYLYDTYLAVFRGTCDDAGCIQANDDTCNRQSIVTWDSVAGETYYIRVYGWDVSQGTYVVRVSDTATDPAVVDVGALIGAGVCADPDGVCDTEAVTVQARKITWNVTRGDLTAGLSYTATTSSILRVPVSGDVVGVTPVVGVQPLTLQWANTGPIGIFDDSRNIGNPPTPGSLSFDGTTYTQSGSGGDIWDGGDDFYFAYKYVTGDFVATCRIVAEGTNDAGQRWGRHGLMARWDCGRDAKMSMIDVMFPTAAGEGEQDWPRHHFRLFDNNAGNNRDYIQANGFDFFTTEGNRPRWQKLIRRGNAFYSYLAEDADLDDQPDRWVFWGSDSAPPSAVPDQLLVGFALQGRQAQGNTCSYDNMTIEPYDVACDEREVDASFFGADYAGLADGSAPPNARVVQRGGAWTPQVVGERLRITDQSQGSSANAVWYSPAGTETLTTEGFVAEFDAFMAKDGTVDPADGFAFAVLPLTECPPRTEPKIAELTTRQVIGNDVGGGSNTLGVPGAGPFTSISTTAGDIWEPCDHFEFAYTETTGDFDISVEIVSYANEFPPPPTDGTGRWGKIGLMARQSLAQDSRYTMSQFHGPGTLDEARQAGRTIHEVSAGCTVGGGIYEDAYGGAGAIPRFLRLTRRGNAIRGWASNLPGLADGTLDPCSDCNWTFAGRNDIWGDAPSTYVGFANSQHNSSGAVAQTVEFRLLGCGGGYLPQVDVAGDGGGALGFDAGVMRRFDGYAKTGGRGLQDHPSVAIEFDNWVGGGEPGNEPAGSGAPDFDGNYHVGVDIGASVSSLQTNVDFGVPTAGLPSIFDPAGVHVEVFYQACGQIDVFLTPNAGGDRIQVLSTSIVPLAGPVAFGFTGGTGGATCTQEVDNVSVKTLKLVPQGVGPFRRGDANNDGGVDLSDGVFIFNYLFLGGDEPACLAAADTNGQGEVNISSGIYVLNFLFLGGDEPPAPFPDCGRSLLASDVTLGCLDVTACEP